MRQLVAAIARLRPWKLALLARVWLTFLCLLVEMRWRPLPAIVQRLDTPPRKHARPVRPTQLSRASYRVLRVGPYRPRCIYRALVLFYLLRKQGDRPVLVIGLPEMARDRTAHAWVELDGVDVGPPPGRAGHNPFVKYPEATDRPPS